MLPLELQWCREKTSTHRNLRFLIPADLVNCNYTLYLMQARWDYSKVISFLLNKKQEPKKRSQKKQEKSSIPNTERRFNREAQESTGIPCEDVTDVSPLVCIQQVNVRGVLDALPQVHQAAHQNLDIWEEPEQQSLYNKQNIVFPAGAFTWKNILTSTKINYSHDSQESSTPATFLAGELPALPGNLLLAGLLFLSWHRVP